MSWADRLEERAAQLGTVRVDLGLAAVLGMAAVISVAVQEIDADMRSLDWIGILLTIAVCASVAYRRSYPLAALSACAALVGLHVGVGYPEGILPPILYFMAYSVAAWGRPNHSAIGLGICVAAVWGLLVIEAPGLDTGGAIIAVLILAVMWFAGHAVRWRRDQAAAQVKAAKEHAEIETQRAARAVAEERLRIAQDLHDIVAHSMSVIAVQAGMGSHLLHNDPDQAAAALEAISNISRSTLDEMRRLLGALRSDDGGRAVVPAPSLNDLATLVEDVRGTGLPVELHVERHNGRAHPGVELSVYRIVQEALTNVIRHAGATTAVDVTVIEAADALTVEVSDNGRGLAAATPATPGSGNGLVGMRERVEVWGGKLVTGPRPGGGYTVKATFPARDAQ